MHLGAAPPPPAGAPAPPPPPRARAQPASCVYQDDAFVTRVLKIIADHDPAQPLFLFWAPVRRAYWQRRWRRPFPRESSSR